MTDIHGTILKEVRHTSEWWGLSAAFMCESSNNAFLISKGEKVMLLPAGPSASQEGDCHLDPGVSRGPTSPTPFLSALYRGLKLKIHSKNQLPPTDPRQGIIISHAS